MKTLTNFNTTLLNSINFKTFFSFIALVCFTQIGFGQTTIFNESGGGSEPSGWAFENNVDSQPIDKSSYWLTEVGAVNDFITTSTYNLSSYISAQFSLDIASYGGGSHNAAKIEISTDNGVNYTQVELTNITTSNYVSHTFNLANLSNQVVIRLSSNGSSGRHLRLQNLELSATENQSGTNWAGTTSSDWAIATNWSTGVLPTSNDDVYIDGTFDNHPSISIIDATAKSVTIATGNTLAIDETSSLTVSGDFTNTGTVTLNSTEDAFSSLIVEGTATGNIVYNRYVNSYDTNPGGGGWDLVGAPAGMTIADFITANGDNIKVLGDNYAFGPYDNAAGQWNLYATTTTNTCTTGGTETFTNIGSSSSSNSTRTWTGDDGSTWTATNARTDQTINGAAITLDDDKANTYVQSGTISGGICNITISTQRAFGGDSGNLDVLINGSSVGTVPYSGSVQTTTISDINITGDIVIRIDNNIGGSSGGGDDRVIIDDVTWTANTPQDLGSFTTTQGYAMATNTGDGATVAFTGPIKTTSQSINVINNDAANEGAGRKWNLVSNPFPSYINGNTAAQATNNFLEANSSVFESEYIAVYGWSGTAWSIYNQLTDAFSMAPGQAFWISAASTSEVALDFTAAMRTTTGTGDFIAGPQLLTYNLELILKDESQKAITNFYFRDGLSLDLDPGYDAGAYNQSMALSTRLAVGSNQTAFSINAMSIDAMQNTRVPLEIRQAAGQAFTISIADMDLPEDIYVYLEDTLNGTLTSLKEGDFELVAQSDLSGADRFFIVFKSNSVLSSGDTLGINALNVFKANNDDFVTIAGITPELEKLDVTLYSILGVAVKQTVLNTSTATQRVSTQGLASGLYIVQIKSGNQTTVKKIIIK